MSVLEDNLAAMIQMCKIPKPEREFRFDASRRWRFDFAWPKLLLAVEVEGGVYSNGRHSRGKGFEADIEKYNAAIKAGWRVLRCTARSIKDGQIINDIECCLYGGTVVSDRG
jgi:very-short-patch-repair endonuclease